MRWRLRSLEEGARGLQRGKRSAGGEAPPCTGAWAGRCPGSRQETQRESRDRGQVAESEGPRDAGQAVGGGSGPEKRL